MAAPVATLAWDFTATFTQVLQGTWVFLLGGFVGGSRSVEVVCKVETSPDDKVLALLQKQLERCGPSQLSSSCPDCPQCHLPLLLLACGISCLVCLVLGFLLGSAFGAGSGPPRAPAFPAAFPVPQPRRAAPRAPRSTLAIAGASWDPEA